MEVFDAPLQLQDLVVPRLDLVERLSRRLGVVQDLITTRDSCFSYSLERITLTNGGSYL